jgi:hypothetical protein
VRKETGLIRPRTRALRVIMAGGATERSPSSSSRLKVLHGAKVSAETMASMATGKRTAKDQRRESAGRKHIMCKRRVQEATLRVRGQVVNLNEKQVVPADRDEDGDVWVLDTGASNHMTGRRDVLTSLDTSIGGTVRFGDGSLVAIKGMGSVMLQTKKDGHKVLTEVYFIPKLKSNIVSLGQLEEGGCKVVLEDGYCSVFDVERTLLAHAPRVGNRLYLLKVHLAAPVCLAAKTSDKAWLWHGRYGHLNFRALHELGQKGMVEGLPLLDRVEEFCDGCVLGKHHRQPFPQVTSYRADSQLDLFHADLCGQIKPKTPGVRIIFYFWLMIILGICGLNYWKQRMKLSCVSSVSRH